MDQTALVIQDIIKHNFVEINIYTGSISTQSLKLDVCNENISNSV